MKSPLLIGLAWAATVALAFLLGGQLRPKATARDDRRAMQESSALPAPEAPPTSQPREARAAAEAQPETRDAPVTAKPTEDLPPVTIDPAMAPADLSALLMRYAASKLAQGPEGQKELFREFDKLVRDKAVREMFRDENRAMPLLYPWVRFLVDHDRQVVAMTETLYKTAAEDPQWFDGLDNHSFQAFTEGLAILLPGAVDEEQLARFRAYAEKIVSMPKESLPDAIRKNQDEIQRNLEWWSKPLAPEQLLQALNDPSLPLATKVSLLRHADPAALRGVDVTSIASEALREGNPYAMQIVARFHESISVALADAAFVDGVASGKTNWYQIASYASVTQRSTWDTLRPFLETGLARGGKATEAFAQSLLYFRKQAPQEFVSTVLTAYPIADETKTQLKKVYGIE